MQIPVFDFSNAICRALGWTLIHSMWQGIAVALFTAILLKWLQHRSAQTRYQVAYCALLSLLPIAIYDFGSIFHFEQNQTSPISAHLETGAIEPISFVIKVIGNQSFTEQCSHFFNSFLNPYLGVIALTWSIGFCFFGLQLTYNWWRIRGYQRRAGMPLDTIWQVKLQHFQQQLSNNRSIQLLEVAWTQVPLTIGWLKPIIFVPIGMVNRLQPADVEAILAHELAHIIKNDYFFNFLQAVVEVLFYYHPAVWWLSSVIRAEREMRCDDMAIAICGNNRLAYAKTLVQLQSQFDDYQANSKLALHFKKQPSLLFRRIQRIFSPPIKHSEKMDKMIITGLLLCGILIVAVAENRSNNDIAPPIINKILNNGVQTKPLSVEIKKTTDTLPPKMIREERIIVLSDNGSDTVQMPMQQKIIRIDTMVVPQTGKVRIIKSLENEPSDKNNAKEDPDKIITGSINEFRRNSEAWFTITKYRSMDGDTRVDTIHWGGKTNQIHIDKGKWDTKSVIVTENDPLLKTIETELKKDALILNTRQYEFILNEKELNVNGNIADKKTYDKYKEHYKQLTNKQLGNGAFALTITKKDTISKGKGEPLAYSSSAPPPKMIPGHCYAMCKLEDGTLDEWREILCSDKVTPELFKLVIAKLKADGSLAASASATEFTKDTRIALTAYQKKYKLPQGNLNLETVKHMDITVK
jgi:beta-lactamase regulating signal transducer with metallopeptidase domain